MGLLSENKVIVEYVYNRVGDSTIQGKCKYSGRIQDMVSNSLLYCTRVIAYCQNSTELSTPLFTSV